MKKKLIIGFLTVAIVAAGALGGMKFYQHQQKTKLEKQMAAFESVDTLKDSGEKTVTIDGIKVPLSKKPSVSTKTTTKRKTKVQKLKKKATRSRVRTRIHTKKTTKTSQSKKERKVVNTTVVTTTKQYDKRGSKKRTIKTTIKTTVKTTKAKLTEMSGVSGTTLRTLGAQADKKILDAFEELKFKMVINKNAKATGVFSVRNHKIELESARSSVLLHELGHFASFLAGDKAGTKEWKSIYAAEKNKYTGYNKSYVTKSASEYFAESYKDYKENPSALKSKRPRTYKYIRNVINGISIRDVQNIKNTYGEYWGL